MGGSRLAALVLSVFLCVAVVSEGAAAAGPGEQTNNGGGLPGVVLFAFTGIVRDAVGRPLTDATVADGSTSVSTDSDGRYELPESTYGSFSLAVSRTDLVTQAKTKVVQLPTDSTAVDFAMLYVTSGALDRAALSTASGPATATVTINTFAPTPGTPGGTAGTSCVAVTDSRSGSTTPAIYGGTNADGSFRWAWTLNLPQGTIEAAYTLSLEATDCSSGTNLTPVQALSYLVDNTAPAIGTADLIPVEGANVLAFAEGVPLAAHVANTGGSAIDPDSFRFTLTDDTTATSLVLSTGIGFDAAGGWARTPPRTLTPGHRYHFGVAVADVAGNAVSVTQLPFSQGGGFLAVSESFAASTVSIPVTPCDVSDNIDPTSATRTVTCTDVPLALSSSTAALSGSMHPGVGTRRETISLDGAIFSTTAAGVTLTQIARPSGDPSWTPWEEARGFAVPAATESQAIYAVGARVEYRPRLVGRVPAAWTSASISMPPQVMPVRSPACPDPVATRNCYVDPVAPLLPAPGAEDPPWVRQLKLLSPSPLPDPPEPVTAASISTQPVTSDSWYITHQQYADACEVDLACGDNMITQRGTDEPRGAISTILSFGSMCGGDSLTAYGPTPCSTNPLDASEPAPHGNVGTRASWYWWGYWTNPAHDGSGRTFMSVGTNNARYGSYATTTVYENARNFREHAVNNEQKYAAVCSLANLFFPRDIWCSPGGANDIETGYSTYGAAEPWLSGWTTSVHERNITDLLYNYGAMFNLCSSSSCWDSPASGSDNGWTPRQINASFVGGCGGGECFHVRPMPQIYHVAWADYWAKLRAATTSHFGAETSGFRMWANPSTNVEAGGVLPGCGIPGGDSPSASYQALATALGGYPRYNNLQHGLAESGSGTSPPVPGTC